MGTFHRWSLLLATSIALMPGSHLAVAIPPAGAAPAACGTWQNAHAPSPASDNSLTAVTALAPADVWAVGNAYQDSQSQVLIEHRDAAGWHVVPGVSPGSFSNGLSGISAATPTDIWAVGTYANAFQRLRILTEHWDGTSWSAVPAPNPGSQINTLAGVAAVSANDAWAVGQYADDVRTPHALVEHWNGTAWRVVPIPDPGMYFSYLLGVTAISATDVWAVGFFVDQVGGNGAALAEHWDGSAWTVVPTARTGQGDFLQAVTASGPNDVWAVGSSGPGTGDTTLVEHWNGTAWSIIPSQSHGVFGSYLYGVAIVNDHDIWAVGYYIDDEETWETLTEQWDGTTWREIASPYSESRYNYLNGVAHIPRTPYVLAVGDFQQSSGYRTLSLVTC